MCLEMFNDLYDGCKDWIRRSERNERSELPGMNDMINFISCGLGSGLAEYLLIIRKVYKVPSPRQPWYPWYHTYLGTLGTLIPLVIIDVIAIKLQNIGSQSFVVRLTAGLFGSYLVLS